MPSSRSRRLDFDAASQRRPKATSPSGQQEEALLLLDRNGIIEWGNAAVAQLLGYGAAELVGMELSFLQGLEINQVGYTRVSQSIAVPRSCEEVVLVQCKNSRPFWCSIRMTPQFDAANSLVGFKVVLQDVTEAHTARRELERSNERLQLAIDGAGIVIWDWDVPTGQVQVGPQWSALIGTRSMVTESTLGDWKARVHPDDRDRVFSALNDHLCGRAASYSEEYRIVCEDGRIKWVYDKGMVIERSAVALAHRVCGVLVDVTARREAELARQRREHLLSVEASIAKCVLEYSSARESMPRILEELGCGLGCQRVAYHSRPDCLDRPDDSIEWTPQEGVRPVTQELETTLRWLKLNSLPESLLRLPTPNPTGALVSKGDEPLIRQIVMIPVQTTGMLWGILELNLARELTDWSIAEDDRIMALAGIIASSMLREASEEKSRLLATAVDQSRDAIIITNRRGVIQYVNPSFEKSSGFSRAQSVGQNAAFLKSDQHPPAFYEEMYRCLTGGFNWSGRMTSLRKDGATITEDVLVSPMRDPGGSIAHFVAVKRDITQELAQERRMTEMERMDSVGRLAGGVAHDFNNMLAVILGNLDTIDYVGRIDTELGPLLASIREAAERSAGLTRQLLAYARKQPLTLVPVDLNSEVSGLLEMLRKLAGEDVEVSFEPAAELWITMLDRSQIDQILVNLVANARDAVGRRGLVSIATENHTQREARPDLPAGNYIKLTVADNGSGMDAATLERIFDPFFTTKGIGRGTGLGLATVAGIVSQSGGAIQVSSELGCGTRFEMLFPRSETRSPFLPAKLLGTTAASEGRVLLLVEDEPALLLSTGNLLRLQGYRVISTATPEAAVKTVEQDGLVPDLLLTDVIMPGMNGHQLHQRLARKLPDLRCLYVSGYPADVLQSRGLRHRESDLLQKPFSADQLVRKIEERLSAAPTG